MPGTPTRHADGRNPNAQTIVAEAEGATQIVTAPTQGSDARHVTAPQDDGDQSPVSPEVMARTPTTIGSREAQNAATLCAGARHPYLSLLLLRAGGVPAPPTISYSRIRTTRQGSAWHSYHSTNFKLS